MKGKIIVSTEEVQRKLAEAERITREKRTRRHRSKRARKVETPMVDSDDTEDDCEIEGRKIGDCIEVQLE